MPDARSASLLAPNGLTSATYRSAAERLFDAYALHDPLFDLTSGSRRLKHHRADDGSLLSAPKLLSGSASNQRPLADDHLLSRRLQRLDPQDDAFDEFFAGLEDETVDQKEGSELLDE